MDDTLFSTGTEMRPLAERLRPQTLDEVVGQDHLFGEKGLISRVVKAGKPVSLVLWGPPGCGKTTIARLYAQAFSADFLQLSAVFSGVADIRKAVEKAQSNRAMGRRTVLFVDEIHRFNKAQQDAFLPYVEDGTFLCVGATTENPSFELNGALLSRMQVVVLRPLDEAAMEQLLQRAEAREGALPLTQDGRHALIGMAHGDGRYALNLVETLLAAAQGETLDAEGVGALLLKRAASHDKSGDGHYNLISALHKSIRGSDPDAALYWFCRMLEGGDDPLFIARRLIRMASEDIGLADPDALPLCVAARDSYQMLGTPEGELSLAQAVVYLALAPKSNAVYMAYKAARVAAAQTNHVMPPKIILNAPTSMMKGQGYGEGYLYDHDTPHGFSGQDYFPDEMGRKTFYHPVERGTERDMKKRIDYFNSLRQRIEK